MSADDNEGNVFILIETKARLNPSGTSGLVRDAGVPNVYLSAVDKYHVRVKLEQAMRERLQSDVSPIFTTNYDNLLVDAVFKVPHHGRQIAQVPALGETILSYVCSPERVHSILGDLEEIFRKREQRAGVRAARRWYWWQVVRAVCAFGFESLKIVSQIQSLLNKIGF
jgi:hypothetical protein